MAEWIFLKRPIHRLPIRDSLQIQRNKPKVRGWKKIFHANGNEKNGGAAMHISTKETLKQNYKKRQRRTLKDSAHGINSSR